MYLSIMNSDHDLAVAISGMAITDSLDPDYLAAHAPVIQRSRFVVTETNVRPDVLAYILALSRQARVPCLLETVSIEKSLKILDVSGCWNYMTPNIAELAALSGYPIHTLQDVPGACARLEHYSQHILVTLGEDGVYVHECAKRAGKFFPSYRTAIVDATGAGDAFVAGFVSAIVRNCPHEQSLRIGIAAATLTLQSEHTVNPHLSFEQCAALARKEED
jgi:pseudouridine kinase